MVSPSLRVVARVPVEIETRWVYAIIPQASSSTALRDQKMSAIGKVSSSPPGSSPVMPLSIVRGMLSCRWGMAPVAAPRDAPPDLPTLSGTGHGVPVHLTAAGSVRGDVRARSLVAIHRVLARLDTVQDIT